MMTITPAGTRAGAVALIPARGGSKGLPGKNVRPFLGHPLIAWTIDAALNCPAVTETWVSTEDAEIAETARILGAQVIDRPAELASDHSSSSDVVRHALRVRHAISTWSPEAFVLLQPTSPLRTASHLTEALALLEGHTRSVISVCSADHHPLKMLLETTDGALRPVGSTDDLERPRQALPPAYRQNGAIYAMRSADFLAGEGGFLVHPVAPYRMDDDHSVDIDMPADLETAERRLNVGGCAGRK